MPVTLESCISISGITRLSSISMHPYLSDMGMSTHAVIPEYDQENRPRDPRKNEQITYELAAKVRGFLADSKKFA